MSTFFAAGFRFLMYLVIAYQSYLEAGVWTGMSLLLIGFGFELIGPIINEHDTRINKLDGGGPRSPF